MLIFFPTLCPALFTLGHLLKQSAVYKDYEFISFVLGLNPEYIGFVLIYHVLKIHCIFLFHPEESTS